MTMAQSSRVNKALHEALGERRYGAEDDPIALLRAESRLRNPWIAAEIAAAFGTRPAAVLDIGCGGGFLSNHLGSVGHRVTSLDASSDALAIASRYDRADLSFTFTRSTGLCFSGVAKKREPDGNV